MVGRRSRTDRIRRDMDALKADLRELGDELRDEVREAMDRPLTHPFSERVAVAIRKHPLTAVAIAAALTFVGARLAQGKHREA